MKIEYLVSSGFDIEFKNKNDQTPLQLAVEESHIECAIKLLELGSNPNIENKYGLCFSQLLFMIVF